ncbi:MAG TPA: hypothetical protein VD969_15150 [Symbiobacteriaceae bacterium]|nr:hypothetical protein [Symbiobacteriaceae bacterium]
MLSRRTVSALGFALCLLLGFANGAAAGTAPKADLGAGQEIEFVKAHPDIYNNPDTFREYSRERVQLLLGTKEKGNDSEVGPMAGSFDYVITDVYSFIPVKTTDLYAYPVWENTVVADWGSGDAVGTWTAMWTETSEAAWQVQASVKGEFSVPFFTKLEATIGGQYGQKTTTTWSTSTQITFNIPEGSYQTLYAYQKGYQYRVDCDCQIEHSAGTSRVTISGAVLGTSPYPYQAITFKKGPITDL